MGLLMGYSCSARASHVLKQIDCLDEFDISSPNHKYFYEIGKENNDGAITGIVFEFIGESNIQEGYLTRPCKKAGSFRIEPDGSIKRFPGIPKHMYNALEIAALIFKVNHES